MRTWTKRPLAVGAVVAAVVGLTACNGDGADPPTTTTSGSSTSSATSSTTTTTSPSTTTAPTIDPASLPPEATQKTEAGAQAFAKFYWEQVGDSLASGDVRLLESLASPACEECTAVPRAIKKRATRGEHTDRSPIQVALVAVREGGADRVVVNVAGKELAVRYVNEADEVVETTKPGVFTWATSVAWDKTTWRVVGFEAA
ncbi:DUF6318 family protein [Knoellia koreensis]|uniref:DUF6318 domain-containing protein n=1 Tax=Knoellia koreensis TaxID=2730921 RepID=A0A849H6H8_9MICO|nr:DUF6318 family protein [Knoellia sp. DB2414S]NNM45430.1 hypothetical protein [Knoellia sp. DB2414S]